MNYVIGLDVWEGQLEVDEKELKNGNVKFIIIRLNDMNGGHHKDEGFNKQWEEAESFIRWPYFVYNPWVNGNDNFTWLNANMPAEATHVSIDVEVKYSGTSPITYGQELKRLVDLAAEKWSVDIYTGGWFLHNVVGWPTNRRYWWARYLNRFYPDQRQVWSWEKLHNEVKITSWNPGGSQGTPGPCSLWQLSGDRLILPGTVRAVDVNIFNGTEEELIAYIGSNSNPSIEWKDAITAWARTQGYDGPGPE